jgi:hypothetical protein
VLGNHTNLIDAVEQEYSIGSTANGWPITDDYDQISAIYTDAVYQCPMSIVVNDSLSAGIPTWRYLYNATFPDIQPFPGLGAFHGSEGMPSIFILLRLCSRFFGPSYSCPPTDPLRWSPSPLSRLDLVCGSRPTKQSWMLYLHPPISLVVENLSHQKSSKRLFCFFKPKHQSIPFPLPLSLQKSFADDVKSKTVPLIFGNLPTPPNATAFEMTLSKYMQRVWANFAKNPQAGPPWPQYPSVAVLGTMGRTVTTVPAAKLDTRCPFLNPYLELAPLGAS